MVLKPSTQTRAIRFGLNHNELKPTGNELALLCSVEIPHTALILVIF